MQTSVMNRDEGAYRLSHQRPFGWRLTYSKTCVKRPLSKRQKIGFQDLLSLNAGQKYCIH